MWAARKVARRKGTAESIASRAGRRDKRRVVEAFQIGRIELHVLPSFKDNVQKASHVRQTPGRAAQVAFACVTKPAVEEEPKDPTVCDRVEFLAGSEDLRDVFRVTYRN